MNAKTTPEAERAKAESRAWDALGRYKFWMFGYWAACWVQMNRVCARKADNPWHEVVAIARRRSREGTETPKERHG